MVTRVTFGAWNGDFSLGSGFLPQVSNLIRDGADVACPLCKCPPLRHVNTDNIAVGAVLLREHNWYISIKCIPDHTVTFRYTHGAALIKH